MWTGAISTKPCAAILTGAPCRIMTQIDFAYRRRLRLVVDEEDRILSTARRNK